MFEIKIPLDREGNYYNLDAIYSTINSTYTGHQGLSIDKLRHALMIFKDAHYGPSNWKWSDDKTEYETYNTTEFGVSDLDQS